MDKNLWFGYSMLAGYSLFLLVISFSNYFLYRGNNKPIFVGLILAVAIVSSSIILPMLFATIKAVKEKFRKISIETIMPKISKKPTAATAEKTA
ncbi:hypothetical protein KJ786_02305 [Patescibacteria group bacterium]|nr:hypothetical protein [Patescibacteria group bacterium]